MEEFVLDELIDLLDESGEIGWEESDDGENYIRLTGLPGQTGDIDVAVWENGSLDVFDLETGESLLQEYFDTTQEAFEAMLALDFTNLGGVEDYAHEGPTFGN
jgi:hypothetical protein